MFDTRTTNTLHGMLFFILCLFVLPVYSEAHQIQTSGSLSILQHSDPNDTPYAGTTTLLYLNFTDTKQAFSGEQCECTIYIAPYSSLETIKEVSDAFNLTNDLERSYNENYSFPYIFPKRDVYAIVVEGTPVDGIAFEPFRIVFDLRVAHEVESVTPVQDVTPSSNLPSPQMLMLCSILGILLAILIRKRFIVKK